MNLMVMVQSVMMMGSILGIGALLTKKVSFHEDTRILLTSLIVYVAVPSMVLESFIQLPKENGIYQQLLIIFLFSVGLYAITSALTWWTARMFGISKFQASQMSVIAAKANTGFIGLPLCLNLFDSKGVILAAVFDTGVNVSLWTISVMVLKHRYTVSLQTLKPLINMPIIAFALGLFLPVMALNIPQPVLQLLVNLAALASPLALIYIGFFLPKLFQRNKQIAYKPIIIALSINLFLVPILTIGVLALLHLDPLATQVILLMSTIPTGSMVPIFFAQFKADEEFGAQATVYATLTSLLTIPLMYAIGNWLLL